jgi:hypothetical protein
VGGYERLQGEGAERAEGRSWQTRRGRTRWTLKVRRVKGKTGKGSVFIFLRALHLPYLQYLKSCLFEKRYQRIGKKWRFVGPTARTCREPSGLHVLSHHAKKKDVDGETYSCLQCARPPIWERTTRQWSRLLQVIAETRGSFLRYCMNVTSSRVIPETYT